MLDRLRVTTATLALAAALATPGWAQTPEPVSPSTATEAALETQNDPGMIVVTGSRIRRSAIEQDAPVVFVDQEALARTGLSSAADILQRLPSSGGGLNQRFNNSGNFGNPPDGGGVGAGAAEIDLRYLGSRRTLVLVDGLRFVNGSSASGIPAAVDLNALPVGMIERVEVLQAGASPIYGSDAIAGVVNIITKDGQDGLQASAQYGQYLGDDDGETQDYNISWGVRGDTTRVVIGASYVDQNPVRSSDRRISLFPEPGATACGPTCSSATPDGRFIVGDLNATLKAPVTGRPRFDPNDPFGPNSDFRGFTTPDRFNFAPFNFILTPSERLGLFASVNQELGERVNFRVKAIYSNRKSRNQAAPLPLFVGPDAGNGNLLDRISIDATNPFNPFGTLSAEPGATNYAFIGRRFVENGPRRYSQNVDTMFLSGTLDGNFDVGDRKWFWDVNGSIGYADARQTFLGNVNAANLARALGPLANCTGECVPFNIFGGAGSITQAQIDYVTYVDRARSSQRLYDYTANLAGELFDLPGGPLGIAIGVEHRDQRGKFIPDPIVQAGLGSDIPAQRSGGRFNVDEAYLELSAPLLRDVGFAQLLEAKFAVRYSDYSTFGGTTNLSGGLSWKPVNAVLFRGTYTEGFRAPGIGELFGTPSRFDQELIDPCSDFNNSGASATVIANCVAEGVPSNGSYVQANPQLPVITGGNADLAPETSKGYYGGVVISPELGGGARLDIAADYSRIRLRGAIASISADTILGRCATARDAFSCDAISRTATGAISSIQGLLQNIGAIRTEAIDVTLNFRTGDTGFGTFGINWANSYLLDFTEIVPATAGTTAIRREGTERGSPDQAYPRYKSNATIDWSSGDFALSLTGRYISRVTESQNDNRLGSRFYGDVQASFTPALGNGRLGFTVGVNNVFDKDPPGCISCGLNNFDPTTYDVPGRFGYLRVSYRM